MDELAALVSGELPAAVALRHRLHAEPRLSGDEDDTAEVLCAAIGAPRTALPRPAASCGSGRRPDRRSCCAPSSTGSRSTSAPACPGPRRRASCTPAATTSTAPRWPRSPERRGNDLPIGLLVLLQPREEHVISGAVDVLADEAFAAHAPPPLSASTFNPLARGQVGISPGRSTPPATSSRSPYRPRRARRLPHRTDDPVLALAQVIVALHHLVPAAWIPSTPPSSRSASSALGRPPTSSRGAHRRRDCCAHSTLTSASVSTRQSARTVIRRRRGLRMPRGRHHHRSEPDPRQ